MEFIWIAFREHLHFHFEQTKAKNLSWKYYYSLLFSTLNVSLEMQMSWQINL